MALSLKALAITSALVGGGIAIPVYLRGSGQSVDSKPQELRKHAPDAEHIEKLSCNVSDLSDDSQNESKFLQGRKGEANLYSLASCESSKAEGEKSSFLGANWSGLFPKHVLNTKLSINTDSKFDITVKIVNEEGYPGTVTVFNFNNPLNGSHLRTIKEDGVDTDFQKFAIVLLAEGVSQTPKNIYIFIDSLARHTDSGAD